MKQRNTRESQNQSLLQQLKWMIISKNRLLILFQKYFKTKVELKENIDPEIIGGFILQVDDNYIDASIRNKLRKLEKNLMEALISFQIEINTNKDFKKI